MTAAQLEAIYRYGNYAEASVWFIFSLRYTLLARRLSQPPLLRRWNRIAAGLFLLFGFSDIVEVGAGSWWKPWWLLVWKACCVLGLAIWAGVNLRHRRDRWLSPARAGSLWRLTQLESTSLANRRISTLLVTSP